MNYLGIKCHKKTYVVFLLLFVAVCCKTKEIREIPTSPTLYQSSDSCPDYIQQVDVVPTVQTIDAKTLVLSSIQATEQSINGQYYVARLQFAINGNSDYVLWNACTVDSSTNPICYPSTPGNPWAKSYLFDEIAYQLPPGILTISARACTDNPVDPSSPCGNQTSLSYIQRPQPQNLDSQEISQKFSQLALLDQKFYESALQSKKLAQAYVSASSSLSLTDDSSTPQQKALLQLRNIALNVNNLGTSPLAFFFRQNGVGQFNNSLQNNPTDLNLLDNSTCHLPTQQASSFPANPSTTSTSTITITSTPSTSSQTNTTSGIANNTLQASQASQVSPHDNSNAQKISVLKTLTISLGVSTMVYAIYRGFADNRAVWTNRKALKSQGTLWSETKWSGFIRWGVAGAILTGIGAALLVDSSQSQLLNQAQAYVDNFATVGLAVESLNAQRQALQSDLSSLSH